MKINQISVFLDNRKGRLFEVCSLLGKHKINIRALNVAEAEDFGVLRMVVDEPAKALKLLKDSQFVANLTEIVAVEVEDRPGGLAEILRLINLHEINIEYMYGFVEKKSDKALMVFRFDNPDKAIVTLTKNGVKIVTEGDVKTL
jgi:hypothetical protein